MEYDLDTPESWIIYPPPPCDGGFDDELLRIAGLNPHGEPMLRKVWGATHRSKGELTYKLCSTDPVLCGHQFTHPETGETCEVKTLAEVPAGVLITVPLYEGKELGELRWIIERWVSPEDLEKQGYFNTALQYNVVENWQMQAEAKREFLAMVRAGEDPEKALMKVENQCDRARTFEIDQDLKTYFDSEWRTKGDYQFFFRLERADGTYHPADGEALEAIAMIWNYNQTVTPAEHEARLRADAEKRAQELNERRAALWHPDNAHARQVTLS